MSPKEAITREPAAGEPWFDDSQADDVIMLLDTAGYVIVPRETTGAMRSAAYDVPLGDIRLSGEDVIDLWDAMVLAAIAETTLKSHE